MGYIQRDVKGENGGYRTCFYHLNSLLYLSKTEHRDGGDTRDAEESRQHCHESLERQQRHGYGESY
jgi:hypothetical protein